MDKFSRVSELLRERHVSSARILDIGCRRQGLKPYVAEFGQYFGADLFQTGSVDFVGDFTHGIPIEDRSMDITIALDVIEHTGDMTAALDEMMRVTSKFAIVLLPNHAHFFYRFFFFATGRLSDKWDIRFPLPLDRHRWLTTATNSDAFIEGYAAARGFKAELVPSKIGTLGSIFERSLGKIWPDFWLRQRLYVLSPGPN